MTIYSVYPGTIDDTGALAADLTINALITAINANAGWTARLESATGTDFVLDGGLMSVDPTSAESQAVDDLGGTAIRINSGPLAAAFVPDVDHGTFPFTVTFSLRSQGQTPDNRVVTYGDGNTDRFTPAPPVPWTHTFEDGDGAEKTGTIYTFAVTMTESKAGEDPASYTVYIKGTYLQTEVVVEPPGYPGGYQWPVDAGAIVNNAEQFYGYDGIGSRRNKAIWGQPYPYKPNGTNAVENTYRQMRVIFFGRPASPGSVGAASYVFKVAAANPLTLDPTLGDQGYKVMAVANMVKWVKIANSWMENMGVSVPYRTIIKYVSDDVTTWTWEFKEKANTEKLITFGPEAQLQLYLLSATETLIATIGMAGSNGAAATGMNDLKFASGLTGTQTVAYVGIGFRGGFGDLWPKSGGVDKAMVVDLASLTISDARGLST